MSKYTRSLPIPIISLLNKNRELIYDARFPNMAIVGHALCVSKAKRTALACAHSEAQASKRRTVGFYKDPVFSADDISYGLLAFHYLDKSQAAIEPFMDSLADFIDTVPKLETEREPNVSEARVNEREASVEASVSANVSERERESAKTSSKTSTKKKAKTSTGKRTGNAKKEREYNTHKTKSTSVDDNPQTYFPINNVEAKQAADYLASLDVDTRSIIVEKAFSGNYTFYDYTDGNKTDEHKTKGRKMRITRRASDAFMARKARERTALMHTIYREYVKGQKQDETANTDSTTQNAQRSKRSQIALAWKQERTDNA